MITQSDLYRIDHQLAQFDCNSREAQIYIAALQSGPSTVQDLARKLGFNRVTVHSAIEQLIQKGLLFATLKGKRRLVAAESPSVFARLIEKKEAELQVLKDSASELAQLLSSVENQDARVPTVRFYEEVSGLKKMLEETLATKSEVLVFSYVDLLADLLQPSYLEGYFKRRADRGIHSRLIFPPGPFAKRVSKKAQTYKTQIRVLPPEYKWQSGFFSWDQSLAVLSYTQGKVTCTVITNSDISYFYRNVVFELVWGQAKPLS